MRLFKNKNKKQKQEDQPATSSQRECFVNCYEKKEVCPCIRILLKVVDFNEVELKDFDIDNTIKNVNVELKSARKEITDKLEEVESTLVSGHEKIDNKIALFEKNIREQEKKDRVDTIARTTQIGLLAVRELLRIQRVVVAEPRERVGTTNFDIYGIDKYFGKDYNGNCIKEIWYIEKLCRLYDKSFFDDSPNPKIVKLPDESSEEKSMQITKLTGTIITYATGILLKIQPMLQTKELVDTKIDLTKASDSKIVELMQHPRTLIQKTVSSKINLEKNS